MTREKILLIGALGVLVIVAFAILVILLLNYSQQSTIQSESGKYLSFLNGSSSKIFLIDSHARYDVYDINMTDPRAFTDPRYTHIKKGDACVIINASIRNDYDRDYWLVVVARLYNTNGDEVGNVTQFNAAWKQFEQVHARSNETTTFDIYVRYDKKDVERYDLFLDFKLLDMPMP